MKMLKTAIVIMSLLLGASCGPAKKSGAVENGLEEYAKLARTSQVEDRQNEGTLWSQNSAYLDAFRDVKARHVADIVTIEVLESTSAVSEATTETSKESAAKASISAAAGLEKKIAELPGLLDLSSSKEFSGDASTTRRSVLTTSLTAKVVEVFPNGNLLLQGNREIMINGERQIVVVRGVVRPNDISSQNVVASTRIAELEIEVVGEGIVSRTQEPGILFKILSGIWPF